MALLAALALGGVGAAAPTANLSCAAGGTAKYDVHRANLTVAAAAAWCRNSSRCAGFAAEAAYPGACTADASAVLDCHFMDSWAARRRGGDASWTYWGVPGPRPKPPPKPYPTPPNPCGPNVSDSPKYHIMNLGIGPHDLNSIVHWRGMWHVMHQANWTDWAHLVSTDLAHWTRLPSVLSPNGDWDGALTILDGKPVILFDCFNVADCRPPPTNNIPAPPSVGTGTGDPPIVGVARPADPTDPNLTVWKKDPANPIAVSGAHAAYAGPSTIWQEGNTYNSAFAAPATGWICCRPLTRMAVCGSADEPRPRHRALRVHGPHATQLDRGRPDILPDQLRPLGILLAAGNRRPRRRRLGHLRGAEVDTRPGWDHAAETVPRRHGVVHARELHAGRQGAREHDAAPSPGLLQQ